MFCRWFVFLFSCAAVLFAEPDFISTFENDPSALIEGRVNALTGRLSLYEEDLVIQGAEPIRICRMYIDGPRGEWRLGVDFAKIIDTEKPYRWVVWEKDRCPILYKKIDTINIEGITYIRCEPSSLEKGFSNTARGEISSRTNLRNNRAYIDEKRKFLMIHSADGTVRRYKKIHHSDQEYRLLSEHLPNGNWVLYDYKETEIDSDRTQFNLSSIRTTNPAQTKTYAWAEFHYEDSKHKNKHLHIVGSDGQSIHYYSSLEGRMQRPLEKIISSSAPDKSFQYLSYRGKYEKYKGNYIGAEQRRLQALAFPLKRQICFDYYKKEYEEVPGQKIHLDEDEWGRGGMKEDPRRDLVKTIASPVGNDPTPQITHSLVYEPSPDGRPYFPKTSVYDCEGNRIDYFSDWYARIQKIERYSKEGKRLNGEKFEWSYSAETLGCLLSKTYLDGDLRTLFSTHYVYDSRGNILEKRFCGNLSGSGSPETYSIKCTYSQSEPNLLLLEEYPSGLRISYQYLSGTDLPIARLTYDQNKLQLRHFFEYNPDRILIREIEDDGSSSDPCNLSDVTVRTIREISPLETGPYLGLPHIIEEKYGDRGGEHLLKKIVLSYTTGAKVEKQEVYDSEGQFRYAIETKYDEKGRVIRRTNPLGQEEICSYDLCGNLKNHRDFSETLETAIETDFSNRPIAQTQKGGICLTTAFTHDKKGNLTSEIDPRGNVTRYDYDALGRRIATELPRTDSDAVIRQEYDSAGNAILKIDAEGNVTRIAYNAYGKPTLTVHPDEAREKSIYSLDGQLKTSIDPEGVSTSYTTDFLGRLTRKTIAGVEETWAYKGKCLISKTDAEDNKTAYIYDGAGRKIAEEQNGERLFFFYDSLGRLSKTQRGDLLSISEYDLLDRVVEERTESVFGELFRKIQYEYDSAGNQNAIIRYVAGEKSVERKRFDPFRRLIEKTDPLNHKETIAYDDFFSIGLRKTHTDPLGLQTIETYNPRGQLVKTEKCKGQTLSTQEKTYNKNGLPIRQIDAIPNHEICIHWAYDSRNRLKTLIESDSKTTQYEYTPTGRLHRTIKPSGLYLSYTYNELGFLTSLISSDSTVRHEMDYDKLGRLIYFDGTFRKLDGKGRLLEEDFSNGLSIKNAYDKRGCRVETSVQQANSLIEYAYTGSDLSAVSRKTLNGQSLYTHHYTDYDLSGNLLAQQLIGDLGSAHYSIDSLSRKTQITAPQFTQQILEFDPIGNILKMRRHNETFSYTYDDLYQLTSEPDHQYTHDAHYNRLQKDSESYTVNDLNQLISHFEYDLNGNPIRQNQTIYTYDALDRLICIETPHLTQTFTYDFLHRRLTKTSNGKTTYFLYDGQNEIGAFDETLSPLEFRVLGPIPHAEIGAAIAIELKENLYAPIHDLQGNIAALLPRHLEPPTFYRYTAFGEEQISGPAPNPWRFSSKRTDETGLIYFGRRYYEPALGRWLTPDPAGFSDGINLYAYVHNDPLTHVDDYGLVAYHYLRRWESTPWNSEYSLERSESTLPLPPPGQLSRRAAIGHDYFRGQSPYYYVNGILNTLADSRDGAATLLKTHDNNANIIAFHSPSFGIVKDGLSVRKILKYDYYESFTTERLNRRLQFDIALLDAAQDLRKVFLTGFSRGCAEIFNGTYNLIPEQRNRLIITACGPIMILPRDLGFSVTNLISEGDSCSLYCTKAKRYKDHYDKYADIEILQQKDGFSCFSGDHFFKSKTYQEGIKKYTVELYRKYGQLK